MSTALHQTATCSFSYVCLRVKAKPRSPPLFKRCPSRMAAIQPARASTRRWQHGAVQNVQSDAWRTKICNKFSISWWNLICSSEFYHNFHSFMTFRIRVLIAEFIAHRTCVVCTLVRNIKQLRLPLCDGAPGIANRIRTRRTRWVVVMFNFKHVYCKRHLIANAIQIAYVCT